MIVDRAIYRDGVRVVEPHDLAEMHQICSTGGGIAWIGLYKPSAEEFADIAGDFDLHALAVEDAIRAHQRPKLDRYGNTLFCVLRPARYIEETESVEFGEIHVFVGRNFVITVRHTEASELAQVRAGLEARPDLINGGPVVILHAIMDRVVDDYTPVVNGLQNDIDEIEDEVFDGTADASRRIYELAREVIAFQRATKPLGPMLQGLRDAPDVAEEEKNYLRDVHDHAMVIDEQVISFRQLLQNILNVNLTLQTKALAEVSNEQNEEVKKISAWAAILFAPSIVGTIYGMNFDNMPELKWQYGYVFALGLMLTAGVVLYMMFKRLKWI